MPNARPSHLTRRGLLTAGSALGLGAVLAACGSDDSKGDAKKAGDATGSADKGAGKAGPWSFKDDLGQTAKTDSIPKNIVAFTGTAAALFDYGIEVKGVFGPTKTADGKADVQAGDIDISKVEIIGNVYGEFNVEKYASLAPEVLITNTWDGTLWYVPEESKKEITAIAPGVAIAVGGDVTLTKPLERMAELAKSLGADLGAKAAVEAKTRFETAAASLRAAVKSNPGIKVLAGSGSADLFYVSTPKTSADLKYFQELGVEFVVPDKLDTGGFFESLSWENADKYQADLILLDNRTGTLQDADLKKGKPTWAKLAAVKAGQVTPRVTEPIFSYGKCALLVEELAKAVQSAKKVA